MHTSGHWQIPFIVDVIGAEQPQSVLDVGCGHGKYGVLAREYASPTRVDAIEVDQPRFGYYDHVYQGDVRDVEKLLPADPERYDLAMFLEVIEHLEKPEGFRVLDALTRRARRVLVTTPLGFRRQVIPGAPYETHRSGWYPWDFWSRYRVHRLQMFPGHWTRHLRLPRLWQLLALVSRREA